MKKMKHAKNTVMKNIFFRFLLSTPLFSTLLLQGSAGCAPCCPLLPRTCFIPLSQGSDLSKQYHIPFSYDEGESCECTLKYDISARYEFQRSGNSNSIAQYLFGQNPITMKGSTLSEGANGTTTTAWMAEYFGMGGNTNCTFSLSPRISNNIVDIQGATGGEHFWMQVNIPIVRTAWNINGSCCAPIARGTIDPVIQDIDLFAFGADLSTNGPNMTADGITPITLQQFNEAFNKDMGINGVDSVLSEGDADGISNDFTGCTYWGNGGIIQNTNTPITKAALSSFSVVPLTSSSDSELTQRIMPINISGTVTSTTIYGGITQDAIKGAGTLANALSGFQFGQLQTPQYNKFNFGSCNTTKWGVADLHIQLGCDFINNTTRHVGLYLRGVIPTGGRTNQCWAQYVFSPVIGNGGHVELGLGITGHNTLWNCDDSFIVGHIDGYFTHLFSATQLRTFDRLPADRFAIVKELSYAQGSGNPGANEPGNADFSDFIYKNKMYKWGDITASLINTSIDIRGEAMFDLIYHQCDWEVGLGYAFSGATGEVASCTSPCYLISGNNQNGEANPLYYGYKADASVDGMGMYFAPQNMSDQMALYTKGAYDATNANSGPFYGATAAWVTCDKQGGICWAPNTENRTGNGSVKTTNHTMMQDVFPNKEFTLASGLMGGQILNRVFIHLDYAQRDCDFIPQIGILGSYGFTTKSNTTAAYWDIGARIGCSF